MTGVQDRELQEAFRRCGFTEADADRGVRRMATGRYADFTDVAISLAAFSESARRVRPELIAEVARSLASLEEPAHGDQPARGRTRARAIIAEHRGVRFSAQEVQALLEGLPLTEAGELDEAAFRVVVEGEIAAAREVAQQTTAEKRLREESDEVRAGMFGRRVDGLD